MINNIITDALPSLRTDSVLVTHKRINEDL